MKIYYLLILLILAGCSSEYDDNGNDIDVPNQAPAIGSVSDQTISANQASDSISVMVTDDTTPSQSLQITLSSDNQSVIQDQSIVLESFTNNFVNLVLTPEAGVTGNVTVTIQVTDTFNASASVSFGVTVVNQQVSADTFIRSIFAIAKNDDPTSIAAIELIQDIDDETQFDDLIDAG